MERLRYVSGDGACGNCCEVGEEIEARRSIAKEIRDKEDRTEEADKVAARIAALLSEKAFSFTPNEYLSIHRK